MASTSLTQLSTRFKVDGRVAAYVVRGDEWPKGLNFVTPDAAFIQVGSWRYDKGKRLAAHVHKEYPRTATRTQEMVFVKQGKMRAVLYDAARQPVHEIVLEAGDLLVITEAGHGYEILADDTQILEVKNGPFVSVEHDKEKFEVV